MRRQRTWTLKAAGGSSVRGRQRTRRMSIAPSVALEAVTLVTPSIAWHLWSDSHYSYLFHPHNKAVLSFLSPFFFLQQIRCSAGVFHNTSVDVVVYILGSRCFWCSESLSISLFRELLWNPSNSYIYAPHCLYLPATRTIRTLQYPYNPYPISQRL